MINSSPPKILAMSILTALLAGCSDAKNTIVELEPIVEESADTDNGSSGDHSNDVIINSMGRLAVTSLETNTISVVDIDDGSLLDNFIIQYDGTKISASADNRYAVLASRNFDTVAFLDGGLWQEAHGDHFDDYKQAPNMSDFVLTGSRPSHISAYDNKLAIFYDGDSEAGTAASVHVVSDNDIVAETGSPSSLQYSVNMRGVAEPRGEFVLASVRRDDLESSSNSKILPDQVGVYHLHGDELELEQVLDIPCPDLRGAAQNHEFVAFGCGDGVLVAHEHDGSFEAHKIDNIAAINGRSVDTLYGHEDSETLVGIVSSDDTGEATLVSINPEDNEMELLDWQPLDNASPVSYSYTYDGKHFIILDNQGYLTLLAVEQLDGHTHLTFEDRLGTSDSDLASMPEQASFAMTVSKNDNHVYVADPIAQHILQIDIETMGIEGDIELDFVPSSMVWLGIAAQEQDHDH